MNKIPKLLRRLFSTTGAIVLATSILPSCGTLVVRESGQASETRVFYPASKLDLGLLYEVTLKGDPLFAAPVGQESHSHISVRIMVLFASLIDLPISLASDTIFLPLDLLKPGKNSESKVQAATSVPQSE